MSDRITAMDVENQEFKTRLRGLDPDDVRLFLKSVAEEIGRLNLVNGELREEVAHLKAQVEEHRTRERTLQETLVTAQQVAGELREKTQTEADLLVREARIKAERMLQQAQDQLAQIESEISRTRIERETFENRVRNVIEEHLALIDLRKSERGKTDNIRYLRRRPSTEAG